MRRIAPRCVLFVPARERMLSKVPQFGAADALMPDLEDSIAPGDKAEARGRLAAWLREARPPTGQAWIPRVNAVGGEHFAADVAAVAGAAAVGAVSVGKVGSAADMAAVDAALDAAEAAAGRARGSVGVLPWIETAAGVARALEILAHPRVVAAAFGADDFLADAEVERAAGAKLLDHARAALAVAARALRVPCLESPFPDYRDAAGLRAAALDARGLGFAGMFAIHPDQVAPLAAAFAPDPAELRAAARVAAAYRRAEAHGAGSTSVDGRMVDRPVYERALKLLRRIPLPEADALVAEADAAM
jgi:citrate lyase beta subunit